MFSSKRGELLTPKSFHTLFARISAWAKMPFPSIHKSPRGAIVRVQVLTPSSDGRARAKAAGVKFGRRAAPCHTGFSEQLHAHL